MKKVLTAITIISLCTSAMLAQGTFSLKGPFPAKFNGKKAYIVDLDSRQALDSTKIVNSKIDLLMPASDESRAVALSVDGRKVVEFILEPGVATINEEGQVKGTKLNDLNEDINDQLNNLYADYKSKQTEIMKSSMTNEEKVAAVEKLTQETTDKSGTLLYDNFNANKNNPVGYILFIQIADGMTTAELDALLDGASDALKQSRAAESLRKVAINLEKTAEGQHFANFTITNSKGKQVSLSDYVGKGDYVLVDFFASWCGPCRREMPTLKSIYNKHNGKGLKVVGLAVWDEPADTQKCVEELSLPWTIIDNAGSIPTDIYGVRGIPHIIVFGPDGTIVSRGLRGEELATKIDTLLAK